MSVDQIRNLAGSDLRQIGEDVIRQMSNEQLEAFLDAVERDNAAFREGGA